MIHMPEEMEQQTTTWKQAGTLVSFLALLMILDYGSSFFLSFPLHQLVVIPNVFPHATQISYTLYAIAAPTAYILIATLLTVAVSYSQKHLQWHVLRMVAYTLILFFAMHVFVWLILTPSCVGGCADVIDGGITSTFYAFFIYNPLLILTVILGTRLKLFKISNKKYFFLTSELPKFLIVYLGIMLTALPIMYFILVTLAFSAR